ncbi:MAG: response regulator transcription factor [Spirochaetota bacterium]
MKARILVVEDVAEMAELISLYLRKEGIETVICESGEEGLLKFLNNKFDLVILDINLPGIDGFEFLQKLRKNSSVPVVIVSAREADEDMIMGLGIGADEFVNKPFSPKVLVARIRAILRRISDIKELKYSTEENVISFGPFMMDFNAYIVKRGDVRIPLSPKEFEVLAFLVKNAGKSFSPEAIYESVWKNKYGDLTAVAVYVQRLRKKIEDDPQNPVYVETMHGMGYRFNPETLNRYKE